MITEDCYKKQMKLLEGLIAWKISDQSYKAWKDSLEEDGFEDKHLITGISKIKDWLRDPEKKIRGQDVNYGTLARACGNVRRDYILYESDQERAKRVARENEQAKEFFHNKTFPQKLSPYAKRCLTLIRMLYSSEIKIEEYKKKYEELNREFKIHQT